MASPICFVNTTKSWGGGERWHFETALAVEKVGEEVLFIFNKGSELEKKIGAQIINTLAVRVSNLSFLNPLAVLKLRTFFKRNNVDTVVLNTSIDLKLAGIAAKLAGVRRIIYRRGSAIPIKNKWLNRYLLKNVATDILANSEETKQTVSSIKPNFLPEEKIKVIFNGLNIQGFDEELTRYEYQAKKQKIVIGNLGRLVYQKGQEFLIDLAEELRARNVNFRLVIGGEGELRSKLENQIQTKGLDSLVSLVGYVERPSQFMADIDVFILSSRWEGFGYVLAEAMLAEKPCIAFNLSSNPELIENERNGYLIEPFSIEDLADRIELLSSNEALRKKLGIQGRQMVKEKFDAKIILPQLMGYLME